MTKINNNKIKYTHTKKITSVDLVGEKLKHLCTAGRNSK